MTINNSQRSLSFRSNSLLYVILLLLGTILSTCAAFSAKNADITRGRLRDAFASPSGKLTFSPELVIPEPRDPTAILLLSNAVQALSVRVRECKSNVVFVQGSLTAAKTIMYEQESARGNFPGPVPVVYCSAETVEILPNIANTGVDGVLVPVCGGKEMTQVADLLDDATWKDICQNALTCGLQPIPEITIGHNNALNWAEEDVASIVEKVCSMVGSDPVAVVFTINPVDNEQTEPVALPKVPKALGKRIPVLGSVRVVAGENRLNAESQRYKDAGFTGAFLRSDCVPGFRMNPDLDIVGKFWSHCISDLKSTKSKSFAFRSKNNMEKSLATKWANYQNSVIQSGALGDPTESVSINSDAGDYQGFA